MDKTDAELIERLELKVAYLEQANQELSDVLYAQQKALDDLTRRLERLGDQIEVLESRPADPTPADEQPPHY